MKIKKLLIAFLSALMIVSISAFAVACDSADGSNGGGTGNGNSQVLAAQVGYYFEIPTPSNLGSYDSVKITDKNGNELAIEGGKVFFDTLGDYEIAYLKGDKCH